MPQALSALRDNAKALADMGDTTFVTDAQWKVFINYGYKALYDILLTKYEDYFESEHTATTTATTDYALPSDFYKLLDVDLEISGSGGEFYVVRPYTNTARNRLANSESATVSYGGVLPRYRLRGSNIRFLPQPPTGLTLRLKYVPVLTELDLDADELSDIVFDQWAEYIELYAAIRALGKEERDSTDFKQELARLQKRIEGSALNRDAHLPQTIGQARVHNDLATDLDVW